MCLWARNGFVTIQIQLDRLIMFEFICHILGCRVSYFHYTGRVLLSLRVCVFA